MSVEPDGLVAAVTALLDVTVTAVEGVGGGDINDAFRLETTEAGPLFVKTRGDAPEGFFETEAKGLRWLADSGAVEVPEVVGVGRPDRPFLALRWVSSGPRAGDHDDVLGRRLAALHASGAETYGLRGGGFAGSLQLSNEPCPSWSEFYATRRLEPLLAECVDTGVVSSGGAHLVERVIARIDSLAGPVERPARLHGDLWAGNAMVGPDGHAVLVDPAAYGGHREVDLAMMRLFGGFSERVYAAYDEAWPLADGAGRRVPLWQLAPLLVHARLFGGGYAASVEAAARACL